MRLHGVREAAVVAQGSGAAASLVAYVAADRLEVADWRSRLTQSLPAHMVPSRFVRVDALPLTANGKLDRSRLPADEPQAVDCDVRPEGREETVIARAWASLLKRERVDRGADFFTLGGHSLLAVQASERIGRELGRRVPVSLLYRTPRLVDLAAAIREQKPSEAADIVRLNERAGAPVVFLVHPVGGDVLCYRELADSRQCTVGLVGLPRDDSDGLVRPRYRSIEELAESHALRILTTQPAGPYCLAGWSIGGLVAMEIAAWLSERGHTVAYLGLIDTVLQQPLAGAPGFSDLRRWARAQTCGAHRRRVQGLTALAGHEYRPRRTWDTAHYYQADDPVAAGARHGGPQRLGSFFDRGLLTRHFAADHFSIVRRPVADDLAHAISQDARRALEVLTA